MVEFTLPSVEKLEQRAHQCRVLAAHVHDREMQRRLREIADDYDFIAQALHPTDTTGSNTG